MNMNERTEPGRDLDALLADFTDRLLSGEAVEAAPEAENDLRSLEDAVLRLHRAFPAEPPDERARKRLLSDFRQKVRREQGSPLLAGWWSRQSRQRLVVAFAAVLILVIVVAVPLFLPGLTGNLQGTAASSGQDIALLIIFGGVLIFLIWQGRHK